MPPALVSRLLRATSADTVVTRSEPSWQRPNGRSGAHDRPTPGPSRAGAMSRIADLAERDGWVCWLCDGPIDPEASPGTPGSATVDHVVPRSRGGRTEPENLRLAHRRCNGARGNSLPELEWPAQLSLIDAAPLWQSLARILKRRAPEIIAVAPTVELGKDAAAWATDRLERFVGGQWITEVERVNDATEACLVRMELVGDPELRSAGRPASRRERPRRR